MRAALFEVETYATLVQRYVFAVVFTRIEAGEDGQFSGSDPQSFLSH